MQNKIVKVAICTASAIMMANKIIRCVWIVFCVRFLKRVCRIETPTYRKWWAKHSKRIQKMLDKEHKVKEIPSIIPICYD